MTDYKSIFISDIHLGTKACQAEALLHFLKNNSSDNLFLVGDIIDGWRLKKKWYFPQSHANVIRQFFTAAKKGTNVFYILGNHDEVGRKFLTYEINIGRIQILNRYEYSAINGKTYLITHGDMFDAFMLSKNSKWIMHLGDSAYNLLVAVNMHFNRLRALLGMEYWSLSKYLKQKTKKAVNFIHSFEERVVDYCKKKGYDGVICGHIHVAEIKSINDIEYMNDGDWCDTCSVLVEHHDGRFELIYPKYKAKKVSNKK